MSRWDERDLPVLKTIGQRLDADGSVELSQVAADTGLDIEEVTASVEALEASGYLKDVYKDYSGGASWTVTRKCMTSKAHAAVG